MSKRAGTVITIEDLVEAIGVDAARYALVRSSADSQIDIDLDLWARRTSDNPVFYVQYAATRAASILRNAADLGLYGRPRRRHQPAHPPAGERAAAGPRRVPVGRRHGRRAARAAPGRALPRGEGRQVRAAVLGRLPGAAQGRRRGRADGRSAAAALEGHPHRPRERPRPARRHRPGADVTHHSGRRGRPRSRRLALYGGALGRRRPRDRRPRRPRPRDRVRHAAARARRGRPARALPRLARGLRRLAVRRRRRLRRQGVPVQGGREDRRRGGPRPRRLHRRRARRRAGRRLPRRPAVVPRQQQVGLRARAGRRRRRRDGRRRLLRGDRPAGRRRGPGGCAAAGLRPRHPWRRGAHPRVRPDRPGGPEVRLLARLRCRCRGLPPGRRAARPRPGRHPLPHRQPHLRHPRLLARRAPDGRAAGRDPRRARHRAARARPRWRARDRLHRSR